jgi:hypothetical protein
LLPATERAQNHVLARAALHLDWTVQATHWIGGTSQCHHFLSFLHLVEYRTGWVLANRSVHQGEVDEQ